MATQFGSRRMESRTQQKMYLRQLASKLEADTSINSKGERGDRQLKKDQMPLFAEILRSDKQEFFTQWLEEQVYNLIVSNLWQTKP